MLLTLNVYRTIVLEQNLLSEVSDIPAAYENKIKALNLAGYKFQKTGNTVL